jgi:hypothetical protein
MSLDKQVVSIPFVGGLETKEDKLLIDKGKLRSLTNLTFSRDGSLAPRNSFQVLPNSTGLNSVGSPNDIVATPSGQLLFGGIVSSTPLVEPYSQKTGVGIQGRTPPCSLRRDEIRRPTQTLMTSMDHVTSNGLTFYVWSETNVAAGTNIVLFSIIDETSNSIINYGAQIDTTATSPRCCLVSTTVVLVAYTVAGVIRTATVNLLNGVITNGPTNIINDLISGAQIDLCQIDGAAQGFILYNSTGASDANASTRCAIIDNAGALHSGPTTVTVTGNIARANVGGVGVASFAGGAHVGCVIGNTSATTAWAASVSIAGGLISGVVGVNSAATTSKPALVGACFNPATSNVECVCGQDTTTSGFTKMAGFNVNISGVVASITNFQGVINTPPLIGPILAGKPFIQNGVVMIPVCMTSTAGVTALNSTLFIIDKTGNVIAKALIGSYASPNSLAPIVTPSSLATGVWSLPSFVKGSLSFSSGANTTGSGICRLKLTFGRTVAASDFSTTPLFHANANGATYFSGAVPMFWDGTGTFEAGFHYFPEGLSATVQAGAGLGTGAYQYTAVYEWQDNYGKRHQSAPAVPVSATTTAGNNQVTLLCPTLQLGTRAANTVIVFYRTLVNGTTFFRLGTPVTPILNSLTANTVGPSANDSASDAIIQGNEILYNPIANSAVGAGTLFNDAPPACRGIAVSNDGRIAICGLEDPYEVRFSQAPVFGTGLQWNENLSLKIPQGKGEPLAMAFMDGAWYVFTPSGKYVISGNFPDSTGLNSSLTPPQLIPSDVGCIDQRTVALTPAGLTYQSQHGYYLLDRSRADQYNAFGSAIEGDVLGQTITSAVFVESISQLRLTLPSTGILAYDFLQGQWGLFTMAGSTAAAGCNWNGIYTYVDSAQTLLAQENLPASPAYIASSYVDFNVSPFSRSIRMAWLHVSALSGFQRVRRMALLGEPFTIGADASLVITVDFDYGDAATVGTVGPGPGAYQFTISSLAADVTGSGMPLEFRHRLKHQKCESVCFTFVETPTADFGGAGFSWSGITLELGMRSGIHRLPAGQST